MEPEESTRLYFERRDMEQASANRIPIVAVIDGKVYKTDEWRLYTEECFEDMLAERFPEKKPEQYEEPKGTMQLYFERRDEEEEAIELSHLIEKINEREKYLRTDPEAIRQREKRSRELRAVPDATWHQPMTI